MTWSGSTSISDSMRRAAGLHGGAGAATVPPGSELLLGQLQMDHETIT